MVSQVVFRPPEQNKIFNTSFVEERRYPWVFREQAPKKTDETRKHLGRRPKITVPAPVKRYRQLRRNARERERQGRLNSAFDVLRGVYPRLFIRERHQKANSPRLKHLDWQRII
ncbi:hypothetical protein OS493_022934 [Desmophyllum pertusum]|uniref:BHLH domain-containing protein n=1 Tax=Desmophyllum pertusum TaxID=174260 RepID=A0A9X0D213_9CNID|nr:hypothetical protein OS493_022934 [Desmophyllum pertusum]